MSQKFLKGDISEFVMHVDSGPVSVEVLKRRVYRPQVNINIESEHVHLTLLDREYDIDLQFDPDKAKQIGRSLIKSAEMIEKSRNREKQMQTSI